MMIKPHMFDLHVKTFIKNVQFAYDEGKKTHKLGSDPKPLTMLASVRVQCHECQMGYKIKFMGSPESSCPVLLHKEKPLQFGHNLCV